MTGLEAIFGAFAVAVGLLARWFQYHKPASKHRQSVGSQTPVVTIAVRGPVLKVPSLTDAYSALPPHCWDVLGR